jgi:hypothetical protein
VATTAAISAFRRAWSDPDQQYLAQSFATRRGYYQLLWAHYENSIFDDLRTWAGYKSHHALYRQTRAVYNPTRRLVDLYAGAVYPGVLSEDGRELPDGVPLAIPLADDTPPELRAAIAQTWAWSGWQQEMALMVRYGAALGSVLVEIADEVERQKVCYRVVWPGHVADLTLDAAGNVKAYALEYEVRDEDGSRYTYRKETDGEAFRTFKDGKPFDYDPESGLGAEWDNPYGFVPARWVRHKNVGSDFGAPAIDGSLGKIDELNSLASHLADQAHKVINAPWLFSGNVSLANVGAAAKRGATDEQGTVPGADRSDRESMLWLQGPEGTTATSLAGNLPFEEVLQMVQDIQGEIEADHPELVLWRQLREMSTLTGPAASRVMGDAAANILEAQAGYDRASNALFGMAAAIAGWRANGNGWQGPLNRQQQKFLPFDLTSYERGELDFSIAPRPIVGTTQSERDQQSLTRATAAAAWVNAGLPLEVALRTEFGWSEEAVNALTVDRLAAIKRQQALATEDVPPTALSGVTQ